MKWPEAMAPSPYTLRREPRGCRELSAEKMENNVSRARLFTVAAEMR